MKTVGGVKKCTVGRQEEEEKGSHTEMKHDIELHLVDL